MYQYLKQLFLYKNTKVCGQMYNYVKKYVVNRYSQCSNIYNIYIPIYTKAAISIYNYIYIYV